MTERLAGVIGQEAAEPIAAELLALTILGRVQLCEGWSAEVRTGAKKTPYV
jgi:hypothetical protein